MKNDHSVFLKENFLLQLIACQPLLANVGYFFFSIYKHTFVKRCVRVIAGFSIIVVIVGVNATALEIVTCRNTAWITVFPLGQPHGRW
jgi:hypothetical protein